VRSSQEKALRSGPRLEIASMKIRHYKILRDSCLEKVERHYLSLADIGVLQKHETGRNMQKRPKLIAF